MKGVPYVMVYDNMHVAVNDFVGLEPYVRLLSV